MIASPTATSAAATAITKNTRACPSVVPCRWPKATNARFAAFSMSSIDMKMTSGLRRTRTPSTPDGEQERGQRDIVGLGNHPTSLRLASARTPTMAASSSTEVTSNGNR